MSEEMEALARRAVACPAWRWVEGSQDARGFQVLCRSNVDVDVYTGGEEIRRFPWSQWQTEAVPNLRDPATLGCLLALVREAWGESFAGVGVVWFGGHGEWCVVDGDARLMAHTARVLARGRSEAAALVAALEAAPAKVAP